MQIKSDKRENKEIEERKRKEQKLLLEWERLKLNLAAGGSNSQNFALAWNVTINTNIRNLIPKLKENSDIVAYLQLFERQCKKVNIKSTIASLTFYLFCL